MNRKLTYSLLAILALSLLSFLWVWLTAEQTIPVHPDNRLYAVAVEKTRCTDLLVPITAEAALESPEIIAVSFAVEGKLEAGEVLLEQGSYFHKGQLLYQINNKEAFAAMNRMKSELAAQLVRSLPQLESEFPAEKNKWVRFMEELKPQFLLPDLPTFKSSKERYLLLESGCLETYYRLQEQEVNMTNYFYIAPFDGTLIHTRQTPGNHVRKGQTVARIARDMPFRINAQVRQEDSGSFRAQTALVCNVQGDPIGKAHIIGKGSTRPNGTLNCRFSFSPDKKRPLFHGMRVQLVLSEGHKRQVAEVPATAVRDDKIQVLSHKTLIEKTVVVHQPVNGKIPVEGIHCGSVVVRSFIKKPEHQGRYVVAQ